jgi:hypothetical protein
MTFYMHCSKLVFIYNIAPHDFGMHLCTVAHREVRLHIFNGYSGIRSGSRARLCSRVLSPGACGCNQLIT